MKQKGFTLLEMLLVLFAVSVLSIVTHVNVTSLHEKQRVEQFLKQFSNDILYMQQLAIKRQKKYTLRWFKGKKMYYISESETDFLIVKREYNKDIQLDLHTFPNPMTYNPSGNINRGGTILLSYQGYKYEIVFQLGRGRFTYREVSKRISNG
ncbi:competence protein ComG [Bacillus proteolyticus]|uniref:Competence protein ComG n=1 Tax=Bacillus proteolyticus TaxID=2026192 RepID=A0AA44R600_9BACI|nr:competence type IV pilus minor pilin ComGD [Bacillus proteolyticus]OJE39912.1 competence protein ComG [Bacillus proteolyticus]